MLVSYDEGGVFIADGLDAEWHPQLLRYVAAMYSNPEINRKRAQIIFTCHNLSVMSDAVLRRDEIWFAARKDDSASELFSLADFNDARGKRVQDTAYYAKRYMAGCYGAVPRLADS